MKTGHEHSTPAGLHDRLALAPEVADAIAAGRPVVALESTLISHGLPYPQSVEVARAAELAVREAAPSRRRSPFAVAGSSSASTRAAGNPGHRERRDEGVQASLSLALIGGGWAATTVSATMIAAAAAGIDVFATGGIGGVHRGALGMPGKSAPPTLDISSDLEELARTPVAVVCAAQGDPRRAGHTRVLETRGVRLWPSACGDARILVARKRHPGSRLRPGRGGRREAGRDPLRPWSRISVLVLRSGSEADAYPLATRRAAVERASRTLPPPRSRARPSHRGSSPAWLRYRGARCGERRASSSTTPFRRASSRSPSRASSRLVGRESDRGRRRWRTAYSTAAATAVVLS